MGSSKINATDCDNTVYHKDNPPTHVGQESITPFTVDNAEEGSTQSFINFSTGGSVNGGIGFYGLLPYIMDDEGNLLGKIYHAGDKPTASDVDALPLDGSVAMTGEELWLNNGHGLILCDNTTLAIRSINAADSDDNRRALVVTNSDCDAYVRGALILTDKVNGAAAAAYYIFGEHNKPSGTYSGNNGSQTIDTGGLGDVILVQLTGSGGGFALVTKSGAIGKLNSNNSVFALADTEAKFIGGVLTLNSSNHGVNRSGYGYNWQVL